MSSNYRKIRIIEVRISESLLYLYNSNKESQSSSASLRYIEHFVCMYRFSRMAEKENFCGIYFANVLYLGQK